jgi:zinc D-Ala-D-Ala carboxypeptidase
MKNFKLSPHFTFFEMTHTNHRKYLDENRNVINDELKMAKGAALCSMILEPIRSHFNTPVLVNSGYRCPRLNTAIGGAKTSQHKDFEAADIKLVGVGVKEVFEWVYKESNIRFGQMILEGYSKGNPTWVHISLGYPWREQDKCGQVLTWNEEDGYKLVTQVKWWE